MEQIRIVKEMRQRDERNGRSGVDIRPRYMVWENVPGAFSSNKGEDFRIVLEELAKIADKDAVIPMPNTGKWTTCGCIVGDGWSIAWRVLDAQFWGVPQRRRRIALVADFGGQSAPEVLFVRSSLSGHSEPSKPKRKEPSSDASRGFGADDSIGVDIYNTALTGDKVCPLTSGGITSTGTCPKVMTPVTFEPGIASREGGHVYEGVGGTLRANAGDNQMAVAYTLQDREGKAGGGKGALIAKELSATLRAGFAQTLFQPVIYDARGNGNGDVAPTLVGDHQNRVTDFTSLACQAVVYSVENHPCDSRVGINEDGKVQTLKSRMGTGGGNVPMVLALDRASFNQGKNAQYDFEVSDKGVNSPIVAKGPGAVCYSVDQGGGKSTVDVREDKAPTLTTTHDGAPAVMYVDTSHADDVVRLDDTVSPLQARDFKGGKLVATRYIVRRLTPLECERLQGYPDGWTDIGDWIDSNGKKRQTSDAARYKALGNSIALPPWKWVLKKLCACYERDATLGSLFDGISGFVLLWTQLNGLGSVKFTSEIEEFPIAVCKRHFGDEDTGEKGDFYEAILGRNKTENV